MPQKPRLPSPECLRRRALFYLQRFATSRAHLERVLLRRALSDARELGLEPGPVRADVTGLLDDLERSGLLSDRAFAEGRAHSLIERGMALRAVRAALAGKGVDQALIDEVLAAAVTDENPDWEAAKVFARRRKIGPWRTGPADERTITRELGKLARAGFDYGIARRIVELRREADPQLSTSTIEPRG